MDTLRNTISDFLQTYSRSEILAVLNELSPEPSLPVSPDLSKLTVAGLHALCKERHLRGYSKLKKAELIAFLTTGEYTVEPSVDAESLETDFSTWTRARLMALCKNRKLKNYSKLKKEELIELLNAPPQEEPASEPVMCECECGKTYKLQYKERHLKSKAHKMWEVSALTESDPDETVPDLEPATKNQ